MCLTDLRSADAAPSFLQPVEPGRVIAAGLGDEVRRVVPAPAPVT
jgi:hypothetical protein